MRPVVEDGQAVAHRERLVLVVGDVDEGDPDLALDPLELDLHLLAQLQVERAERLVEQQHARAVDDRAGERDALALAAGELRRLALADAAAAAPSPAPPARLSRRSPRPTLLDLEAVGDVVEHGHVREQRVVLEDRVDVALERRPPRDVDAAELDAPAVGQLEAGDQPQRRRLARAGRPEHREELARARRRGRRRRRRRSRRSASRGRPGGCRGSRRRRRARSSAAGSSSSPAIRRSSGTGRPTPLPNIVQRGGRLKRGAAQPPGQGCPNRCDLIKRR